MNKGFTLLELMFSMSIFSVVAVFGFIALSSATQAIELAKADATVQQSVREVMMAVQNELEQASQRQDPSLDPPLNPVQVNLNVDQFSPVEIVFQRPQDQTGMQWTDPIRFRYLDEDLNGNGTLDNGEDADGDGVLSRRLLRIVDFNGDGNYTIEEGSPVGAANNLSDVQFTIPDGSERQVTIFIEAEQMIGNRNMVDGEDHSRMLRSSTTATVYVLN